MSPPFGGRALSLLLRSKTNDTDVVLADFGFAQITKGKSLKQVGAARRAPCAKCRGVQPSVTACLPAWLPGFAAHAATAVSLL